MSYKTRRLEDGRISLQMGNVAVDFPTDATIDDIVGGINILIDKILGISPFELTLAVIGELEKEHAAKESDFTQGEDDLAQHASETAGTEEVQRETGSHQEEGEPEQGTSSDGKEGVSQEG